MKNMFKPKGISDQEACEVFKEFAWGLASMFRTPEKTRTLPKTKHHRQSIQNQRIRPHTGLSKVARSC